MIIKSEFVVVYSRAFSYRKWRLST